MGIIKRRGAIKKQGPIHLGPNFITFQRRGSKRNFSVHEDLLCSNSKYFERLIQENRKRIDGDCSICHEKLDPNVSDLTFCESLCGQNFHEQCIERLRSSTMAGTRCPICRAFWTTKPRKILLPYSFTNSFASRHIIQSYVDWLYKGELHIDEAFQRGESSYNLQLLKTWTFSENIQDDKFKNAIIAECVASMEEGAKDGFDLCCINYAEEYGSDCMDDFLIDSCLMGKGMDYINNHGDELPTEFVHRLCLSALGRLKGCMKRDELLEKHTKGEYEYETDNKD